MTALCARNLLPIRSSTRNLVLEYDFRCILVFVIAEGRYGD